MPHRIFAYVKGLLSVAESATCTALARVLGGQSHDSLTRILNDPRLEWQTLLSSLALRIVGKLSDGWLIIDDTVIPKQFAKVVENISWVFSSKEGRSVLGLNIVVLCWSNGTLTIPLAFKVWKKDGKKSKFDLALELLSYAKNLLQLQPNYVVFDSWYASKNIVKRLYRSEEGREEIEIRFGPGTSLLRQESPAITAQLRGVRLLVCVEEYCEAAQPVPVDVRVPAQEEPAVERRSAAGVSPPSLLDGTRDHLWQL